MFDIDPLKAVVSVGAKSAMSELSPAGKVIVVVAVPLVRVTGSPRVVLLSLNCTAPVAVVGVIVAVSVSVVGGSAGEVGVTSSVIVVVPASAAGIAVVPWVVGSGALGSGGLGSGAALGAPMMSTADPTVTATTRTPKASQVQNLFLRTVQLTPTVRWIPD